MPMLSGESLAEFDARLRVDHETAEHARLNPPKHARQMSAAERSAAIEAMKRADNARPVVPVMGGRHIRNMLPNERIEAARALGIHNFGSGTSVRFGGPR